MILFQSLMQKLLSYTTIKNPITAAHLYTFYKTHSKTNLTDESLIALALRLRGHNPVIAFKPIPTVATDIQPALLTSPPLSKYGLWVWEAKDPTFTELKSFFKTVYAN